MTTISEQPVHVVHETTAPAAKPKREPYWDNARFVAVVLVVIGHATLKLISGSNPSYAAYLFVYLFQVPLFVLISGYFAKATPPGVAQFKRLFTDIVVPYVIFETIWSCIHWALSGTLKLDYTTAWWTLWFLMALIIWRVVLPYLVVLRYPLLISIAISVGGGYLSSLDDRFAIARAVALLPFFVLGWKIREGKLASRWLQLRPAIVWRFRVGAILLFAVCGTILGVGIGEWRHLLIRRFLLYDENYSSFGYDQWWAGALRLGFLGLGALCCFAALTLIPRGNTWFSGLGQRTMYIYLLHSLVLYPIRQSGILDGKQSPLMLVGVILFSVGLAIVLGMPWVKKVFHPLVEPRLSWLFRGGVDAVRVSPTAADAVQQSRSEYVHPRPVPPEIYRSENARN